MKLVQVQETQVGLFLGESTVQVQDTVKLETLLVAIARPEALTEAERAEVIALQQKLEEGYEIQLEESEQETADKLGMLEAYMQEGIVRNVMGEYKDAFTFKAIRDWWKSSTTNESEIKKAFADLTKYVKEEYNENHKGLAMLAGFRYSPRYNAIALSDPSMSFGNMKSAKEDKEASGAFKVFLNSFAYAEPEIRKLVNKAETKAGLLSMISTAESNLLKVAKEFPSERKAKQFISSQYISFATFVRQVVRQSK